MLHDKLYQKNVLDKKIFSEPAVLLFPAAPPIFLTDAAPDCARSLRPFIARLFLFGLRPHNGLLRRRCPPCTSWETRPIMCNPPRSVHKTYSARRESGLSSAVMQEIMQRLGRAEVAKQEVEVGSERVEPEPPASQEPEEQTPKPLTASMDNMNTLYAHLKAREIDPDTTILASLGEHYVLTIKQWMKLFAWGSYPRATQYFKELKDNDMIYRKDREGRGGTLVEGDWFFLLTKGANELLIPIRFLCGKIKERNICSYTMWKGMNSINGTSNHPSGLASVSG